MRPPAKPHGWGFAGLTKHEMKTAEAELDIKAGQDSLLGRINTQINEERMFKDLSVVQVSRIVLLKELAEQFLASEGNEKKEVLDILENNLKENPLSLVSQYILGLSGFQNNEAETSSLLLRMLDSFVKLSKWPIVDHLADIILGTHENHRVALRAKVDSVGHIKGKKEARPFLERLAKIDRKNPDIARKYALSILEEDPKKALDYLKQAGETYARLKDYKSLEDIWMLIVQHDHKDLAFFERIGRIVVGDRHKIWVATHLSFLVESFRAEENWDKVILLLKRILQYEPYSSRTRSNLVRAYRAKYEGHSLLDEFLKISELTNHKKSAELCIGSFERNIVFDIDNYVYHRTRGVGKITQIDSEEVIIDFPNNSGQKMSIQMAIHSLQPLQANHIWARRFENPQEIEELFKEDLTLFLEVLLSSFDNRMSMPEIKHELTGRLLKPQEWSRWWTRARAQIKKDPRFGFNPNKKDELILRDVPMTLTEELSLRFQGEADWNKKMEIAFTSLRSADTEGATLLALQFYKENEKNKDPLKCLHSYLYLEHAKTIMDEDIANRTISEEGAGKEIQGRSIEELQKWSSDTQVVELKRDFVNLIIKKRPDYGIVLKGFLFEVPIRIHRFVIGELISRGQENVLEDFIDELLQKYREHTEIFLWLARSVLGGQWEEYKWIKVSHQDLLLLVFRSLKPLTFSEKKGIRLKNTAIEIICGTTNITVDSLKKYKLLVGIIKAAKPEFLQRIYALFCDVSYIPEAHKENMLVFIKEFHPNLSIGESKEEGKESAGAEENRLLPSANVILSSAQGLEKRRKYLDNLIHVEMPANSKEIGEAQEKGDLRENAEYKAAMERQTQLQAEILLINKELQKARVIRSGDIRLDVVSIGTRVKVKNESKNENESFMILGPWDVDTDKNIISYESPLAQALLGSKVGKKAKLDTGKSYAIVGIESALSQV